MFEQFIVYKTTNTINNMIYVGVHKLPSDPSADRYLGSNKHLTRSIKKHGRKNFSRETLFECVSKDEAYDLEAIIVDESFIQRKDVYNEKCGGFGGFTKYHASAEFKNTEEYRKSLSKGIKQYNNSLKERGLDHHNKGNTISQEHIEKISAANKGLKAKEKHHHWKISKEDHPKGFLGKKHNKETKESIAASLLEYRKINPMPKKTCPNCSKEGSGGVMNRFHFQNCMKMGVFRYV